MYEEEIRDNRIQGVSGIGGVVWVGGAMGIMVEVGKGFRE
jgi:hypothetical protein